MEGWDHKTKEFNSILERKIAHIYWMLTIFHEYFKPLLYVVSCSIFSITLREIIPYLQEGNWGTGRLNYLTRVTEPVVGIHEQCSLIPCYIASWRQNQGRIPGGVNVSVKYWAWIVVFQVREIGKSFLGKALEIWWSMTHSINGWWFCSAALYGMG